jgi:hypothetical protein
MVVVVKYFHEKDAEEFNELVRIHVKRIIFLHHHLSLKTQLRLIINDLGTENRDIIVVRFPKVRSLNRNQIVMDILMRGTVTYGDGNVWVPKEMWIFNPSI